MSTPIKCPICFLNWIIPPERQCGSCSHREDPGLVYSTTYSYVVTTSTSTGPSTFQWTIDKDAEYPIVPIKDTIKEPKRTERLIVLDDNEEEVKPKEPKRIGGVIVLDDE